MKCRMNFRRESKHVKVVKKYIERTLELKPLTAKVHYVLKKRRKKTWKLANNLKGYK